MENKDENQGFNRKADHLYETVGHNRRYSMQKFVKNLSNGDAVIDYHMESVTAYQGIPVITVQVECGGVFTRFQPYCVYYGRKDLEEIAKTLKEIQEEFYPVEMDSSEKIAQ